VYFVTRKLSRCLCAFFVRRFNQVSLSLIPLTLDPQNKKLFLLISGWFINDSWSPQRNWHQQIRYSLMYSIKSRFKIITSWSKSLLDSEMLWYCFESTRSHPSTSWQRDHVSSCSKTLKCSPNKTWETISLFYHLVQTEWDYSQITNSEHLGICIS
jgi:hypothetical protein